jgi:hypothetical protein
MVGISAAALQIDGGETQSFSSGETDNGNLFPRIEITVTMNDVVCYDIVLHIVAEPAPSPGPAPYLSVEEDQLTWTPTASSQGYDVVCGNLGFLRASSGDFTSAVDLCLADDHPETSMEHDVEVAPGAGVWFLVREGSELGTYDSGGSCQSGSRDAGIGASPLTCP